MFGRIGTFFILVSLIVLFLFAASYLEDVPKYSYLFGGLFLIGIGLIMVLRNRRPSEKAERFRSFRKMRARKKNKIE